MKIFVSKTSLILFFILERGQCASYGQIARRYIIPSRGGTKILENSGICRTRTVSYAVCVGSRASCYCRLRVSCTDSHVWTGSVAGESAAIISNHTTDIASGGYLGAEWYAVSHGASAVIVSHYAADLTTASHTRGLAYLPWA